MKMKNSDKATYREVVKLIEDMRTEILEEVRGLRNDFNELEKGRLSNLETKIATIEARIFTGSSIIAFIISVAIAIVGFIIK